MASTLSSTGVIKEYVIGIEVFDRDEHYNPRIDSIVRVVAGRLRARLEQYFQGPGRKDPLLIRLPKDSAVLSFFPGNESDEDRRIASRLTARITEALVGRGDLSVVPQRKAGAISVSQSVQLEIRIANASRNRKLWVHTYNGQAGDLDALAADAAQGVAAAFRQNRKLPAPTP